MSENPPIGTCGTCGGPVTVKQQAADRRGSQAEVKSCDQCGAVVAEHGPVLPMVPPARLAPGVTVMPVILVPGAPYRTAEPLPLWPDNGQIVCRAKS